MAFEWLSDAANAVTGAASDAWKGVKQVISAPVNVLGDIADGKNVFQSLYTGGIRTWTGLDQAVDPFGSKIARGVSSWGNSVPIVGNWTRAKQFQQDTVNNGGNFNNADSFTALRDAAVVGSVVLGGFTYAGAGPLAGVGESYSGYAAAHPLLANAANTTAVGLVAGKPIGQVVMSAAGSAATGVASDYLPSVNDYIPPAPLGISWPDWFTGVKDVANGLGTQAGPSGNGAFTPNLFGEGTPLGIGTLASAMPPPAAAASPGANAAVIAGLGLAALYYLGRKHNA